MREAEFKSWLQARKWNGEAIKTVSLRMSRVRKFESVMPQFGLSAMGLDDEFEKDRMQHATDWLRSPRR